MLHALVPFNPYLVLFCSLWSLFHCMLHALVPVCCTPSSHLVPIWSLLVHFGLYFTVCCTSWSLFDPYLVPVCCTPSSHLVPIWSLFVHFGHYLVPVCCTPEGRKLDKIKPNCQSVVFQNLSPVFCVQGTIGHASSRPWTTGKLGN